jgi:tetratricopeptide (TPR) repeat protein
LARDVLEHARLRVFASSEEPMLDYVLRVPVVTFAIVVSLLSCTTHVQGQGRGGHGSETRDPSDVEASSQPAIDPHLDEEARQIYLAGVAAYDAGRYEAALEYFSRAYALSGRPLLLFNIGSVTERLRRDEESLEAYEAYLAAVPDAPNRAFVESRIVFLREQLNERARREEETQRVRGAERIEPRFAPEEPASVRVTDSEPSRALELVTNEDEGSGDITREWWFWTLIGVAVVGAGVGIGVAYASADSESPSEPAAGDFGPGGVIVALGEW